MFLFLVFVAIFNVSLGDRRYYHTFNGTIVSNEIVQQYEAEGVAPYCIISVEDCDANEGRRIDGTCNNLKAPSRGGSHSPQTRELPADLCPVNYWTATEGCCSATEGYKYNPLNPRCENVEIPWNDFIHSFSGIRCQNVTTPLTFQSTGCIANGTVPVRSDIATPEIDINAVYGVNDDQINILRNFTGGKLDYDVSEDGKVWPAGAPSGQTSVCVNNVPPFETRCHGSPDESVNGLLGINLGFIWFYRLHNYIADQLALQNPGWDDEKLFRTARDINIAILNQIYYYELLADFMGYENLIKDGIISDSPLHRDLYDENEVPNVSIENLYALRWVHTIQETRLRFYNTEGNYIKTESYMNMTLRTGFLAIDNNIDHVTIGMLKQPSGAVGDYVLDSDFAENSAGVNLQHNTDAMTNDHLKGRYFGLQPYVNYLKYCFGTNVTTWEDLEEFIEYEGIENLKKIHATPQEIELLEGIWLEKLMENAHVPPTFYCIVSKQLLRYLKMDRFHYERANRPDAFTEAQLLEVRKWTLAKVLCTVGDGIKQIQPQAFRLAAPGNEVGPCDETTPQIDFSVFKDGEYTKRK